MKLQVKAIAVLSVIAAMLLAFQNCGPGFSVEDSIADKVVIDDMVFDKNEIHMGKEISVDTEPWSNVYAVEFAPDVTAQQRVKFFKACDEWTQRSALICKEREQEENYVAVIIPKKTDECLTYVGAGESDSVREMRLGKGCWDEKTLLHIIGHSLGFVHEHQRPDRDNFITINKKNIKSGKSIAFAKIISNFVKQSDYDFYSVMHYGSHQFSKRPELKTIQPKPNFSVAESESGNETLSQLDRAKISSRYAKSDASTTADPTIATLFFSTNAATFNPLEEPVSASTSLQDPHGNLQSILWTQVSGPSSATILNPTSVTPLFGQLNVAGLYIFKVVVTSKNGSTWSDTYRIRINPLLLAVFAGGEISVARSTGRIEITGLVSRQKGTLAVHWSQVAGPSRTVIEDPTVLTGKMSGLSKVGIYKFELLVVDTYNGEQASASDVLTVNVRDSNEAPVISFSEVISPTNQTGKLNLISHVIDPDGGGVSVEWSQVSGPTTAQLSQPTVGWTEASGLTVAGIYVFQIEATDNDGAKSTAQIQVRVTDQPLLTCARGNGATQMPNTFFVKASLSTAETLSSYSWLLSSFTVSPKPNISPLADDPTTAQVTLFSNVSKGSIGVQVKAKDSAGFTHAASCSINLAN